LSGKRSLHNSAPKYYHLVRSNDVLYTDRFTIIFPCDRPDPLSELKQKTDPSCLPKFKLLVCAIADPFLGLTNLVDASCLLICDSTDHLNEPLRAYRLRITAKLSGKRSLHNSAPKYYHLVRSNDVLYTDRFTIIFPCDRPDLLSELSQKTDLPCLPNLKLLSFAIADPFLGLTNLADSYCLLICDSTDNLNEPLEAYRFRITAGTSPDGDNI
jgi:hypothetical protein